jgi:hypothetical protein
MQAVKPSGADRAPNGMRRIAKPFQLIERDHPVLLLRQVR